MKKIALFILAAMAVMALLSKLPSSAQARTIVLPTPTTARWSAAASCRLHRPPSNVGSF